MLKDKTLRANETAHVLFLVGYHVECIMRDDTAKIRCSPHRDMPVFEHELTKHNRIFVRNLYMAEVAKLFNAPA